jgi:hypothetical protein
MHQQSCCFSAPPVARVLMIMAILGFIESLKLLSIWQMGSYTARESGYKENGNPTYL